MFCQPLSIPIKPTWAIITSTALADAINPCAIAVLLILFSALMTAGEKRKALLAGISFISALYITYFLLGIGLLGFLNLTGWAFFFHKTIGGLAVVIGLLNIKDFFWYGGGGFVTEIPRSWRPRLQGLLKGVTSPLGAFTVGIAATLFELPCTGGPYAFMLGLLAQNVAWPRIIAILLYYNLIFVLPLIMLTMLLYLGMTTTEKLVALKDGNLRLLHLIAGIIMLILGIWVFSH